MGWVLDLDGVVRLGPEPIPGAAAAVARLRTLGEPLAFVTNNSSHRLEEVRAELGSFGIDAAPEEVVTSALAVASLVEPGERVLACAGPGVVEAVTARGAEVVPGGPCDAVVVGFTRTFDYELLRRAAAAVRGGARLLASNDDASYPTPDGLAPGAGSLLAAVATASGRPTEAVAGKPHEPMAALVRDRLGPTGVVVGDRADTDGRFATTLGYRFALVLTGVTTALDVEQLDPVPDLVGADLAAVVAGYLDGVRPG